MAGRFVKELWLMLLCLDIATATSTTAASLVHRQQSYIHVRGGSGSNSPQGNSPSTTLYVLNPDYQPPQPVTLGDLERGATVPHPNTRSTNLAFDTSGSSWGPNNFVAPIVQFLDQLQKESLPIYVSLLSSLSIFVAWQLPPLQKLLGQHFVCSRRNLSAGRVGALFLSCISHAGIMHLLVNMVALLSFGPQVNAVLQSRSQWPLWQFMLGASLTGSLFYLLLDRHQGGCMGLSGVTLALVAISSRFNPKQTLRFFLGPIPVRMTAEQALLVLTAWSIVGILVPSRSGVAHSAHLGGLVFGCAYYELWTRRRYLQSFISSSGSF